ncbi:MAG TPA: hypothetical protein VJ978_05605 [Nitriliruptoraceae bacterium]|nr:hypothetical protein [Nitriliruptoraceae bacterium]
MSGQPGLHDSATRRIIATAIATTLTIGGATSLLFLAAGLGLSQMGFATPGGGAGRPLTAWFVVLGLVTVLAPPFVGGAAWGAALAWIFRAPFAPAARTGALAFGGMVVVTAAPTDLTQLLLDDLPAWMPMDVHGYFTIVFMAEVGVVAAVSTWRLAKRLGVDHDAAAIGSWTGLAAAFGFLAGSALAVALGVRVFPWERLSMVWATIIALPVSTLTAGAMLGARLSATMGAHRPAARKPDADRTGGGTVHERRTPPTHRH